MFLSWDIPLVLVHGRLARARRARCRGSVAVQPEPAACLGFTAGCQGIQLALALGRIG
jgi:hypothetical protein